MVKIVGLRPGEKIHEVLINSSEMVRTYSFKDMYIIIPCLQNWLENLSEEGKLPLYLTKGIQLNKNSIRRYSSKKAVISKEETESILKSFNIL